MAFCRSSLRGKGKPIQNAILGTSKPASRHQSLASSPSEPQGHFSARAFSSLLSKWQGSGMPAGKSGHNPIVQSFSIHHPLSARFDHQKPEAFSAQQVRHVYVEVIDNDLDAALKVYKRKMNISKIEVKVKEKVFYVKPSEHRKLAKHYKKLNRARRELNAKLQTAKHQMEKVREVRRLEKEEKRARTAAAAATVAAEDAAKAKASQTTG